MVCGRLRRHIKHIESATNSAIYFPPPFPQIYGYTPPGANRRRDDEIFITADSEHEIHMAKLKLHELVRSTQACVKEVRISSDKIDSILLERMDKIKKIIEYNGSYVLFPQLGVQRGVVRVQGTDMLHVERTIREIMSLVCKSPRMLQCDTNTNLHSPDNSTLHPGGSLLLMARSVLLLPTTSRTC